MGDAAFASFTDASFEIDVLQRPGLTLVEFMSDACVPCRQLGRVLTQLSGEIGDSVLIGTVHAPDNPALVKQFGIATVPTLLLIKDGAVVETRTGVDRRQVLKKLVEEHT
jgi:thioredoxin 1